MALQTSGAISFANLQSEFGGSHPITMAEYAAYRVSGSGNTISMSQFYGASAGFSWTGTSSTVPTNSFTNYELDDGGSAVDSETRITMTFGSSSMSYTVRDFQGGGEQSGGTISYSSPGSVTSLQARWVIVNADVNIIQGNHIKGFVNGTLNWTRSSNDSDYDITGAWVTITPSVMGGSGTTKNAVIQARSDDMGSEDDPTTNANISLESGGSFQLQIRANFSGGSDTFTIRKNYISSNNPLIEAETEYYQ